MIWWTPEMDASLRADFIRIGSLRGVAREWGFTVNQVIARAQRIGLSAYDKRKADADRYASIAVPKKRAATTGRSVKVTKAAREDAVKAKIAPSSVEITKAPEADPVALMDAKDGDCRWMVERGFFCGASVDRPGGSWCGYHRAIVYVPAAKKTDAIRNLNALAVAATRAAPVAIANGW